MKYLLYDIKYTYLIPMICILLNGFQYVYGLISFGFFIQWHINLCRLFNAKAILVEKQ